MAYSLREQIVLVANVYAAAIKRSPATISGKIFGASRILADMEAGKHNIRIDRFETAMQWFSDNWPEGTSWPEGVARPEPTLPSQDDQAPQAAE